MTQQNQATGLVPNPANGRFVLRRGGLLLFFALSSIFFTTACANNIWISANGADQDCGISRESACALPAGLVAARPGDLLIFLSGTYTNVDVDISVDNLTLRAEIPNSVEFSPAPVKAKPPVVPYDAIFRFNQTRARLQGFNFTRSQTTAVKVFGGGFALVRFENCNFMSNLRYFSSGGQVTSTGTAVGGAVYSEGGLEFYDCSFISNAAMARSEPNPSMDFHTGGSAYGGAVAIRDPCSVEKFGAKFHRCHFMTNGALPTNLVGTESGKGGAIAFFMEPICDNWHTREIPERFLEIDSSTFIGNVIGMSGSALKAVSSGPISGGAIAVDMTGLLHFSLTNSVFQDSKIDGGFAERMAGAVEGGFISLSTSIDTAKLRVENCSFVNGAARAQAAPIGYGGSCHGGAIFAAISAKLTIWNSNFTSNECRSGSGGVIGGSSAGGAIYIRSDDSIISNKRPGLDMRNCTFLHNTVGDASAVVRSVFPARTRPWNYGGALAIDIPANAAMDRGDTSIPIYLSNCTFHENSVLSAQGSSAFGGAISAVKRNSFPSSYNEFYMESCEFWKNIASGGFDSTSGGSVRGGGLHLAIPLRQNSTMIRNCQFLYNDALSGGCSEANCDTGFAGGGALSFSPYPVSPGSSDPSIESISIIDCEFFRNRARSPGESNVPSGQSSLSSGGAIIVDFDNVTTCIKNSRFDFNSARSYSSRSLTSAGAILAPRLIVSNSTFVRNQAAAASYKTSLAYGGAIYSTHRLHMTDCWRIEKNLCFGGFARGGAVAALENVTIANSVFNANGAMGASSAEGGILFLSHISSVNITGSNFTRGRAEPMPEDQVSVGPIDGNTVRGGCLFLSADSSAASKILPLEISLDSSTFELCESVSGAAIYFFLDRISPRHSQDLFVRASSLLFKNNTAADAGGAVYIGAPPDEDVSQISTPLCNSSASSFISFLNNSALWGQACASASAQLKFVQGRPPRYVWPGETFPVSLMLFDKLKTPIIIPESQLIIRLNPAENQTEAVGTAFLKSGVPHDQVAPSALGVYSFSRVSLAAHPHFKGELEFLGYPDPVLQRGVITEELHVLGCPPGFYLPFEESLECVRCPPFTYNFEENSQCKPCNEEGRAATDAEEESEEENSFLEHHAASNNCLEPPENSHGIWVVKAGYFPVPTLKDPEELIECLNEEACREFNCTIEVEHSKWVMDCSHCDPQLKIQGRDCHCHSGFSDRLCSRCVCNNNTDCFYAAGGEEFECHKCKIISNAVLISSVAALQLSLIVFLVFTRSAVALFLAEFAVVFILIFLGLGEWWLVDIMVIMAVILLISQSSKRKSSDHDHVDHHAEHADAARLAGLIKILLFFMQTTSAVLTHDAWPHWLARMIHQLNALNLRVSGLECFAPMVLSTPIGKFVFIMSMPLILSLSLLFAAVVAWIIKRLQLKRRVASAAMRTWRRVRAACRRRRGGDSPPNFLVADQSDVEDDTPLLKQESTVVEAAEASAPVEHAEVVPEVKQSGLWSKIQYCILFLLFASHFELSNTVLSIIRPCSGGYMVSMPWIRCDLTSTDPEYKILFSLGMFFMIIDFLGLPALFSFLLLRNRHRLHEQSVERKIGFLYESYKHKVYWFEMVWLFRRMLLSLILLIPEKHVLRTAAIVLVLLGSALAQRRWMPFTSQFANYMELVSTICIIYSIILNRELVHYVESVAPGVAAADPSAEALRFGIFFFNGIVVLTLFGGIAWPTVSRLARRVPCIKRRLDKFESEQHHQGDHFDEHQD